MSFDKLPVELVQSVLERVPYRQLPRFVAVNKTWNAVVVPLIWRQGFIALRAQATDPFINAIKQGTMDMMNLVHTKSLYLDLRFSGGIEEYSDMDELEEWIINFKLLRVLINRKWSPLLQRLHIRVSEPTSGDFVTPSTLIRNIRKRLFEIIHHELPLFVADVARNREPRLEVEIDYDDELVQHPPAEYADILQFLFDFKDNITEAYIRSFRLGMDWPYGNPALPNLQYLTLVDRDWGCGTELQWIDFRGTKLDTLDLCLFKIPPSMLLPETLTTIKFSGTGSPVNALRLMFSLPNLRHLIIDQSKISTEDVDLQGEDWHHPDLLWTPIVSLNLETLGLGRCCYHPEVITRVSRKCKKLQTLQLSLLNPSSIVDHITKSTSSSFLDDPPNSSFDYFHAFFRGFGSDVTHVIYVDDTLHRLDWWTLRKTSKRQSVKTVLMKVVFEMNTVREGYVEYIEGRREKEEADIMYWELRSGKIS